MSRPRIILSRRWPAAVEAVLEDEFEVVLNPTDQPFSADDIALAMADADAFCPTVTDQLGAPCMTRSGVRARLIGNFGVGYNHIDVAAAARQGIAVTNTPGVLTDCTADLALTLMLMVARRAGEGERQLRAGRWAGWAPTHLLGSPLSGRTLGIVGPGRIGLATARRAHFGFSMNIVLHGHRPPAADLCAELGATVVDSVDELLARSDFVSLHCPSSSETRGLIDAQRLAAMQRHAYLINTARGDIVVEDDLIEALRTGVIAGAGLDVYAREPEVPAGLSALENVVLLPHLGSATEATRTAMGMRVVGNLRAFFAGERLPDQVV